MTLTEILLVIAIVLLIIDICVSKIRVVYNQRTKPRSKVPLYSSTEVSLHRPKTSNAQQKDSSTSKDSYKEKTLH